MVQDIHFYHWHSDKNIHRRDDGNDCEQRETMMWAKRKTIPNNGEQNDSHTKHELLGEGVLCIHMYAHELTRFWYLII